MGEREEDQLPGFQTITEALRARNDPGLRLCTQVIEGEGHNSGVLAKTFLEGMRTVFQS